MTERFDAHLTPDGLLVLDRQTGAVRVVRPDGSSEVVLWPGTAAPPPADWPEAPYPQPEDRGSEEGGAPSVGGSGAPATGGTAQPPAPRDPSPVAVAARKAWAWLGQGQRGPVAALVALTLGVALPLLVNRDALFIAGLNGDMIATVWFYDLVGRSFPTPVTEVVAFNWPDPMDVRSEFPSATDALLGGLLLRLQGWVAGWGTVQALLLALNTAGAALLARAAGARGAGVFLAGAMALLCRQAWFDLANGRLNAAWPGLTMAAGAGLLLLLRDGLRPQARVAVMLGAAALGAVAARIYPPHLLGFAPLLLVLGARDAARAPVRLLWVAGAVALGLAGSADALVEIAASKSGRTCQEVGCADAFHALSLDRLAMVQLAPTRLNEPGLFALSWVPLLLAPFHRRRRSLLVAAAFLLPLLVLALGPCPQWRGAELTWARTLETVGGLWCALDLLTDYGRAATVAALSAAVLSGIALAALPWPRARWAVAVAVAAAGVGALVPGYSDAAKWHRPGTSPVARFLQDAAPGPIVELPYDMAGQFRSALDAPERPRHNPLKPLMMVPSSDPTLRWLDAIGLGQQAPGPTPTRQALAETGLRWVIFEPGRCGQRGVHCPHDWQQRLNAALGRPSAPLRGAILVWEIPAP